MELSIEEMEKQIIEQPKCCNKPMWRYSGPNMKGEAVIYICFECGGYFQMTEGQMDEEEIETYREIKAEEGDEDD